MNDNLPASLRDTADRLATYGFAAPPELLREAAEEIERLRAVAQHERLEAIQCAAMRDTLLTRLAWRNHNSGMAYVLEGVDNCNLATVLVEAANQAAAAAGGKYE